LLVHWHFPATQVPFEHEVVQVLGWQTPAKHCSEEPHWLLLLHDLASHVP